MKIINHSDIMDLNIAPNTFYNWIVEMLENKDSVLLPPKISMKQANNVFYNVMPCIIPQLNVMGVKAVNRQTELNENIPAITSQILIYNLSNGNLEALVDGNLITAMRTGAIAVHSLDLLAKKDFNSIAILGLGITARAFMDVFTDKFENKQINVKLLKYKTQAETFIERYKNYQNLNFITLDSAEEVIEDSDIIISCVTHADKNFADDAFYKKGSTVIPIHSLGFQNCDLFFDKVFADDSGHVENFKYFNCFKEFAEVADVVSGKKSGRDNSEERILVYNIGLAMHDVYIAKKILDLKPDWKTIDFPKPDSKLWI